MADQLPGNIFSQPGGWFGLFVGRAQEADKAMQTIAGEHPDPVWGPSSFLGNEMKYTAHGGSPISATRWMPMWTWGPRGASTYATKEDLAKMADGLGESIAGHGHSGYEDALKKLAEGLAGIGERTARDGGSYAGRREAEAELRAYTDDLSGFILGYSTGKQFNLGDAPIDIMNPMVRPSLKRGWEYAKDPGLGADFTRAVHTYLLEKRVLSGSRR